MSVAIDGWWHRGTACVCIYLVVLCERLGESVAVMAVVGMIGGAVRGGDTAWGLRLFLWMAGPVCACMHESVRAV